MSYTPHTTLLPSCTGTCFPALCYSISSPHFRSQMTILS
jgi:hypothetical protein